MLCEDLSQQAQQATEEAERLQAELTAAKEIAKTRSKRHVVRRLSQQAQQATEAERLQAELTAAKESHL